MNDPATSDPLIQLLHGVRELKERMASCHREMRTLEEIARELNLAVPWAPKTNGDEKPRRVMHHDGPLVVGAILNRNIGRRVTLREVTEEANNRMRLEDRGPFTESAIQNIIRRLMATHEGRITWLGKGKGYRVESELPEG